MTEVRTSDPWPFEQLDLVSLIPVKLDSSFVPCPAGGHQIKLSRRFPIGEGREDARQVLIQEGPLADPASDPIWYAGPVPFQVERAVTGDLDHERFRDDASQPERERHVSAPLCDVLYGDGRRSHRAATAEDQYGAWGGRESDEAFGLRLVALELLRFDDVDEANGLLIVHAEMDPGAAHKLKGFRMLTDRRPTGAELQSDAALWIDHLLRGVGQAARGARRAFHLCFARPSGDLPRLRFPGVDMSAWEPAQQWQWLLATAQPGEAYPPTARNLEQVREATRHLSNDWTCAVLRTGAVFLTRPLTDEWRQDEATGRYRLEYLAELAPLLVKSLYTDVLALSYWKGLRLELFANALADLGDPVEQPEELRVQEADFTRFRNQVWWDDTGLSGHATMLLRMHRDAHGQQRQFSRLVSDFTDYSQKVERLQVKRSSDLFQKTNALIGLVTFFGVPLATLQVFGTDKLWVWIVVGAFFAILGLLPAGHEIIARNLPLSLLPTRLRSGRSARLAWILWWVLALVVLKQLDAIPTSPESGTS